MVESKSLSFSLKWRVSFFVFLLHPLSWGRNKHFAMIQNQQNDHLRDFLSGNSDRDYYPGAAEGLTVGLKFAGEPPWPSPPPRWSTFFPCRSELVFFPWECRPTWEETFQDSLGDAPDLDHPSDAWLSRSSSGSAVDG